MLNVLTGRLGKELDFKGQVKVNGQDPKNNIASVSGYVQQHDLFIGILTVREHLWVQVSTKAFALVLLSIYAFTGKRIIGEHFRVNAGLPHTNFKVRQGALFVCCRDLSWLFAVSLRFS